MHSEKGTVHLVWSQSETGQENFVLTRISLLFRKDFDTGTYHRFASGTELKHKFKIDSDKKNLLVVVTLGLILAGHDPLFDQDQGNLILQRSIWWSIWTHMDCCHIAHLEYCINRNVTGVSILLFVV